MDNITYSYLNNENTQKAIELYNKIRNEPNGDLIYRFSEEKLIQMLQVSDLLGAWDMERLVGLGILVLGEEANKSQRNLLYLADNITIAEIGYYVDYEYRGKGIAKTLSNKLCNHAREIGINVITASAREENEQSIKILTDHLSFVFKTVYDRGDGHQRNVYQKNLKT